MDDQRWWDRANKGWTLEHARETSNEAKLVCGYAGNIAGFVASKNDFCLSLLYEDLRADPAGHILRVFEAMGLADPARHVSAAVEAVSEDSQRGIFGMMGTAV